MSASSVARQAPLGHRPALDGLRALAIVPVVAFHSTYSRMLPGGAVGVDLFFVVSGFLITTLLLEEYDENGRLAIPAFYARRALRVGPALLLLLAFALLFSLTPWRADSGSPADVGRFSLYALTYTSNWVMAYQWMDWPAFLGPIWSLSLEEQFYLAWPLALAALLALGVRARRIAIGMMVLVAGLSLWSAILWHVTHDVHRVLFGSDTRANGMLFGSALGLWRHSGLRITSRVAMAMTLLGTAVFTALTLTLSFQQATPWLLGLRPVELASGLIVLGLSGSEHGAWEQVFTWRPLRWIGQRSYGIYLWHVAGIWLGLHLLPQFRGLATTLGIAITLALTVASYELVERPALRLKRRFSRRAVTSRSGAEDDATQGAVAVGDGADQDAGLVVPA